ncbi:MAG: hypothetical protein H6607_11675 [Flavobacteriales bacterium]|nr:hypothetical protein [Flavobacteriales bacterium]
MKLSTFTLAIIAMIWVSSCKEDPAPNNNTNTQPKELCDSLAITYNGHIKAIVDAKCNTSGCHAAGAGGFILGTYAQVKAAAETPKLLGSIKHESGYEAMPQGAAKLDSTTIQMFECWEKTSFPEK